MGNTQSIKKAQVVIPASSEIGTRASIPTHVWESHVLPYLDNYSVASFAATDRLFYHHAAKTLALRRNREALVKLVKANNLQAIESFNDQFWLWSYEEYFRKNSPFYIAAAIHRNKTIYDALVAKQYPEGKTPVTDLYYLVLSSIGKEVNEQWHFDAIDFVNEHKSNFPNLIFEKGPDGISCLQAAAINGFDDDMIIYGLLMPLAQNIKEVASFQEQIQENNPRMLWKLRLEILLNNLTEDCRLQVNAQLQFVLDNKYLLDPAPFVEPYQRAINHFAEAYKSFKPKVWDACDAERKKYTLQQYESMPLCILASVYFHRYGTNDPGPTFWEPSCSYRDFRFVDNTSLSFESGRCNGNTQFQRTIFRHNFDYITNSNIMGVCRNKSGRGLICETPSYFDYMVLVRRFEISAQKLQLFIELTMKPELALCNADNLCSF